MTVDTKLVIPKKFGVSSEVTLNVTPGRRKAREWDLLASLEIMHMTDNRARLHYRRFLG